MDEEWKKESRRNEGAEKEGEKTGWEQGDEEEEKWSDGNIFEGGAWGEYGEDAGARLDGACSLEKEEYETGVAS
jgi:hypothetical protein